MAKRFEATITDTWMLTEHVKALRLGRADGEEFKVYPGQFFMMHFEHGGSSLNRSYSAANRAIERSVDELELSIALVEDGIGSEIVERAKVGDTWLLSGPHGRFVIRGEPEHLVLVATGTGIAPYRAMMGQVEDLLRSGARVDLVFGVRQEEEFLYADEFTSTAGQFEGFHYHACCSRPVDAHGHESAGGRVGRVQVALDAFDYSPETTVFYLCGNEEMVDDMKERLLAEGFDRRGVRTEAYVSPPDGNL